MEAFLTMLSLTFIALFSISLPASKDNLGEIRSSFHQSVLDENHIGEYYQLAMQIDTENHPVKLSYKAAAYVLKAKSSSNPFQRIKLVMSYIKSIDQAVSEDPSNVEIRFLRFSIAYYLPNIFGFKKHMLEDKSTIMENIHRFDHSNLSEAFNHYIFWFVENSGYFDEDELVVLRYYFSSDHLTTKS